MRGSECKWISHYVSSVASCVEARGGVAEAAGEEEEVGQSSSQQRKKSKGAYKELNQRVQRCKELERVAQKMKTQKDLMVSFC